ncbi:MAG: YbaB/EbfC family nucleoid-associated protein [Gammaproteobacteria bacterium]|nr:YbaB/EbfC family nucleoid-associated protein [Gammaproteobacteria bacterium]
MSSFAELMKQAQKMQERMQKIQEDLSAFKVVGQAGGGKVKVIMSGRHELDRAFVDPSLLENIQAADAAQRKAVLEDLIVAAVNDAARKIEDESRTKMMSLAEGIELPPEFKLPGMGEGDDEI